MSYLEPPNEHTLLIQDANPQFPEGIPVINFPDGCYAAIPKCLGNTLYYTLAVPLDFTLNLIQDVVKLITYTETQALITAFLAEMMVDTLNAGELLNYLRRSQSTESTAECYNIQGLTTKLVIVTAIFLVCNTKEILKASEYISALASKHFKGTACDCGIVGKINHAVEQAASGFFKWASIILGTGTRSTGTTTSILNSISYIHDFLKGTACFSPHVWEKAIAAIAGILLLPYKLIILSGKDFSAWPKLVGFLTLLNQVSKNVSLVISHISAFILAIAQSRMHETKLIESVHIQSLWLVFIMGCFAVLVPAQLGLNKREKAKLEQGRAFQEKNLQSTSLMRRVGTLLTAQGAAATIAALGAPNAAYQYAMQGSTDTPRYPAATNANLETCLMALFAVVVFAYWSCRLALGLTWY